MADEQDRQLARDPQDLERLLIARQWAGDIDGMVALFEPDAVVDSGEKDLTRGREAIRALFTEIAATGRNSSAANSAPPPSTATSRSPRPGFPTAQSPPKSPAARPMAPGCGPSTATPSHGDAAKTGGGLAPASTADMRSLAPRLGQLDLALALGIAGTIRVGADLVTMRAGSPGGIVRR